MRYRNRATSTAFQHHWRFEHWYTGDAVNLFPDAFNNGAKYIDFVKLPDSANNPPSTEEMWDVSNTGSGHDHPCHHVKRYFKGHEYDETHIDEDLNYRRDGQDHKYNVHRRVVGGGITYAYLPSPVVLLGEDIASKVPIGAILSEHLSRVAIPLNQSISLGNFILELDEMRRMKDQLLLRARTMPVDAVLGYEFGIKPFISDIKALATSMSSLARQLEWLKRNAGKPVRIVTERVIEVPGLSAVTPVPPAESANLPGRPIFSTGMTSAKATVKCVSWVTYPKDAVNSPLLEILAGLRTFGLTNPLQVAWNATRLSFVVDWLFNVSSLIDRLDLMEGFLRPIRERETLHVTVERSSITYVYYDQLVEGSQVVRMLNGQPAWEQTDRVYIREVGLPEGYLDLLDLSLREQWLSLLLAESLTRKKLNQWSKPIAWKVNRELRERRRAKERGWVSALPRRHRRPIRR